MKKKIMDAAIQIIHEDGYEKLSIRKIAKIIQYSPTTLYLYYRDKAEIMSDMTEYLYQNTAKNAAAEIKKNKNEPIDIIVKRTMAILVRSLLEEPEMGRAILLSGMNLIFKKDAVKSEGKNGIQALDKMIKAGQKQGVFSEGGNHTAELLITALLGFAMHAIENKLYESDQYHDLIDEYIELLTNGLKK